MVPIELSSSYRREKSIFFIHQQVLDSSKNFSLCLVKGPISPPASAQQSLFHPLEWKRYTNFSYPLRKASYLQGRYATKLAISHAIKIDPRSFWIENDKSGSPFTVDVEGEVSISHSGFWGLGSHTPPGYRIGVDIESVKNSSDIFKNSQEKDLFPQEILKEHVSSAIWVAREALSKAIGTGLAIPPFFLKISRVIRSKGGLQIEFQFFPHLKTRVHLVEDSMIAIAYPILQEERSFVSTDPGPISS